MGRRTTAVLVAVAVVAALQHAPASAYPRPGRTELVSAAADGTVGDASSHTSSISADGRYVAFQSFANNLVEGQTSTFPNWDIYVRDMEVGTVEKVSLTRDGEHTLTHSEQPSISADGRYVAFENFGTELVPEDGNSDWDVFVHDRETGELEKVSVASDGVQGWGASQHPSISADGRHVAFHSWTSNLVRDDTNGWPDVFVHDRITGTTERVSVASDGTEGNHQSMYPAISGDGRFVAFQSLAGNLVDGDTNGSWDVFVHDRATGVTERVSVASDGNQIVPGAEGPAISHDGRHVAFYSAAVNLAPGRSDANVVTHVYVHDRATGQTERVSVNSAGVEGDHASFHPAISADGRHVVFEGPVSSLVAGDDNDVSDVFVHDRLTRATERVSVDSDGDQGSRSARTAAISADGRYVSFVGFSTLAGEAPEGRGNLYRRDRGPTIGVGGADLRPADEGLEVTGWATFSGAVLTETSADDGAWLTGARLVSRPEQEDLLVEWSFAWLPPLAGGTPGAVVGLELGVDGSRYEVRAMRGAVTASVPAAPWFALLSCDAVCTEVAELAGSFGTGGDRVQAVVPLSVLGATAGVELSGLVAYTGLGEATAGPGLRVDELPLSDATLATPAVDVGVADAEVPASEVDFAIPAALTDGRFAATVEAETGQRVWLRACLADDCDTTPVGDA